MSFSVPLLVDVGHINNLINPSWTSWASVFPLHFRGELSNLAPSLICSTLLLLLLLLQILAANEAETGADSDPDNDADDDGD